MAPPPLMRPRVRDASGSWGLRGVTPPAELIGRKQSYEDFKKLIPVPPCWGDVDLIDRLIFLRAMCNGEILSEDLLAFEGCFKYWGMPLPTFPRPVEEELGRLLEVSDTRSRDHPEYRFRLQVENELSVITEGHKDHCSFWVIRGYEGKDRVSYLISLGVDPEKFLQEFILLQATRRYRALPQKPVRVTTLTQSQHVTTSAGGQSTITPEKGINIGNKMRIFSVLENFGLRWVATPDRAANVTVFWSDAFNALPARVKQNIAPSIPDSRALRATVIRWTANTKKILRRTHDTQRVVRSDPVSQLMKLWCHFHLRRRTVLLAPDLVDGGMIAALAKVLRLPEERVGQAFRLVLESWKRQDAQLPQLPPVPPVNSGSRTRQNGQAVDTGASEPHAPLSEASSAVKRSWRGEELQSDGLKKMKKEKKEEEEESIEIASVPALDGRAPASSEGVLPFTERVDEILGARGVGDLRRVLLRR